ncbi:hypothetical protein EW145_g7133 [Phellinidium pouzarii]|uniref:DUF6532 domain-containing protein n=1 Tax=Phellinidium pouzarii TaxID=167371 RepID=A0A4V3XB11_9AGAM|nr:hypothetical protein EW145_g7133 [Phellinidium pouzarii]
MPPRRHNENKTITEEGPPTPIQRRSAKSGRNIVATPAIIAQQADILEKRRRTEERKSALEKRRQKIEKLMKEQREDELADESSDDGEHLRKTVTPANAMFTTLTAESVAPTKKLVQRKTVVPQSHCPVLKSLTNTQEHDALDSYDDGDDDRLPISSGGAYGTESQDEIDNDIHADESDGDVIMHNDAVNSVNASSPDDEIESRDKTTIAIVNRKRSHSATICTVNKKAKTRVPQTNALRVSTSTSKPKNGDYKGDDHKLLVRTEVHYRAMICTIDAFPTKRLIDEFTDNAWTKAVSELGINCPITDDMRKVIQSRASQVRGEIKGNAASLIVANYFVGVRKNGIQERVAMLLNSLTFVFKDLETRSEPFQHPIFQDLLNKQWFNKPNGDGIICKSYYTKPHVPIPTLALMLTTVQSSLEEYNTGNYTQISFSRLAYELKYRQNLVSINAFATQVKANNYVPQVLKRMTKVAFEHAGVPQDENGLVSMLTSNDFEAAKLVVFSDEE